MSLISKVPSYREAKHIAINRDEILILEKRVTNWIRKIREVNLYIMYLKNDNNSDLALDIVGR